MTLYDDFSSPLIQRRRSLDIFICTIVVSLLLHLAVSLFLVIPGRSTQPGTKAVFVELQSVPDQFKAAPASVIPAAVAPALTPVQTAAPPVPMTETAIPEAGRLEQAADRALQQAARVPEAVHENSIGLGMLSGHFASFAEGATLRDEIREYYFILMRRINEVWWTSGVPRGTFANTASVTIIVARDGRILDVVLLDGTGNRDQDKVLLETVKSAGLLPPLPRSYHGFTFNAPVRFVPPLRLMLPGFGGRNALLPKHGE